MKVFQMMLWTVVFLLVGAVSVFAHCGKDHGKQEQIMQLPEKKLQRQLAEADVSSETLVLEKMLLEKDEQMARERVEEEKIKQKELDGLINKLKISR